MIKSRLTIVLVSLAVLVVLEGCVSTHFSYEPTYKEDSLVLGTIRLEATNYPFYGPSSVNGMHYSGIEIEIRRLDAKQIIKVKSSGKDGFFYIPNLQFGLYQITHLYFKDQANGHWADIWFLPRGFVFDIKKQAVYNLGGIVWQSKKQWRSHRVYQSSHQESIKRLFSEKYPESGWLRVDWLDINFP